MHFLLTLLLPTLTLASTLPTIENCGRYRMNGEVNCTKSVCEFVLFKGSKSEHRFPIEHRLLLFRKLHKKNAEADFIVESIDPLKILSHGPPQSALPAGGNINATIKLLEEGGCK